VKDLEHVSAHRESGGRINAVIVALGSGELELKVELRRDANRYPAPRAFPVAATLRTTGADVELGRSKRFRLVLRA
jgi:hypothetical protein